MGDIRTVQVIVVLHLLAIALLNAVKKRHELLFIQRPVVFFPGRERVEQVHDEVGQRMLPSDVLNELKDVEIQLQNGFKVVHVLQLAHSLGHRVVRMRFLNLH